MSITSTASIGAESLTAFSYQTAPSIQLELFNSICSLAIETLKNAHESALRLKEESEAWQRFAASIACSGTYMMAGTGIVVRASRPEGIRDHIFTCYLSIINKKDMLASLTAEQCALDDIETVKKMVDIAVSWISSCKSIVQCFEAAPFNLEKKDIKNFISIHGQSLCDYASDKNKPTQLEKSNTISAQRTALKKIHDKLDQLLNTMSVKNAQQHSATHSSSSAISAASSSASIISTESTEQKDSATHSSSSAISAASSSASTSTKQEDSAKGSSSSAISVTTSSS